jgi:hypothetical protein
MDWRIELSVKPEDQTLISYVIPNKAVDKPHDKDGLSALRHFI